MRERILNSSKYKWYALVTIQLTTFLLGSDVTLINLALPTITSVFPVTLFDSHWVLTMYFIVAAVLLPIMGRVSDIFQRKLVIVFGCLLYALGAFLAFFSSSLNFLILMRALQGIGSAALLANTNAVTMALFPSHQRGLALGLNGSSYSFGFALGFLFGGYLIDSFGWRSIFLFSLALIFLTLIAAATILAEKKISTHRKEGLTFDYGGALLSIVAIGSFLVGFQRWTHSSHLNVVDMLLFATSITAAIVYVLQEKKIPFPLVNTILLKRRTIFLGLFNRLWMQSLIAACIIMLPFFLQIILKLNSFHSGMVLLTYGVTLFFSAPLGGFLTRKIGFRILTCSGFLIMGVALFLLSTLRGNDAALHSSEAVHTIVLSLFLIGLAAALFVFPNTTITMSATPANQMGSIGGIMWVMVLLGNTFGTTFGATMLGKGLGKIQSLKGVQLSQLDFPHTKISAFLTSQSEAFLILTLLSLIGIFLCWVNPAKKINHEPN